MPYWPYQQKSAVTNYAALVDARASYDRILNVFTLIEEIGTVNENSEPAIIAAEKAYKALSMEERIASKLCYLNRCPDCL